MTLLPLDEKVLQVICYVNMSLLSRLEPSYFFVFNFQVYFLFELEIDSRQP